MFQKLTHYLEYEINNYGVAAVALTSIMFTFEKLNMDVIGSEYVYTACQYFNLKAVRLSTLTNSDPTFIIGGNLRMLYSFKGENNRILYVLAGDY